MKITELIKKYLGEAKLPKLVGLSILVVTFLLQCVLGSDPLICGMGVLTGAFVFYTVLRRPYALLNWYAAYMYLQLYGFGLFVKTLLFIRFEAGLLVPLQTIAWGSLFSITAALSARMLEGWGSKRPLLDRVFGAPEHWRRIGVALLILSEIAGVLAFLSKNPDGQGFGGFDPLRRFSFAAAALLAADAVVRKKIFTTPLVCSLVLGLMDALFFSEKSDFFLRVVSIGIVFSLSSLPRKKKIGLLAGGGALFLFANAVLFPVIHATREIRNQNLAANDRVAAVTKALSSKDSKDSLEMSDSGDIWKENLRFLPTNNWFLLRFGSIAYFDITLKFALPGQARMSMVDVLDRSLATALPAGLYGEKDQYTIADRLWNELDPRIPLGGFTTMGTYASARILLGSFTGYLLTSFLYFLTLALIIRFYGNDIRRPLAIFIFVSYFYAMIDQDLDTVTSYLIRFFWQSLIILLVVAVMSKRIRFGRRKQPAQ